MFRYGQLSCGSVRYGRDKFSCVPVRCSKARSGVVWQGMVGFYDMYDKTSEVNVRKVFTKKQLCYMPDCKGVLCIF
jgi:hypothetical protein